MLNGGFKEAGLDTLLVDINTDAFNSFFYWLNSRSVYCKHDATKDHAYYLWESAVQAYIFADYHGVQGLKIALLDYLFLSFEAKRFLPVNISLLVYPNTTKDDPLRKLLVDVAVESSSPRIWLMSTINSSCWTLSLPARKRAYSDADGFNWSIWTNSMHTHFCERYHVHPVLKISSHARRRVSLKSRALVLSRMTRHAAPVLLSTRDTVPNYRLSKAYASRTASQQRKGI
jgi:hypothetical protein